MLTARSGAHCAPLFVFQTAITNQPERSSQHEHGNLPVQGHDDGPQDADVKQDQDEDEAHRLQVAVEPGELPGQQEGQDVGAVQGRDGNQIE